MQAANSPVQEKPADHHSDTLPRIFLKSVPHAMLSGIPGFLIGVLTAVPMLALLAQSPDYLALRSFADQLRLIRPLGDYRILLPLMALLLLLMAIFAIWALRTAFRLLNPNFSRAYRTRHGVSRWRLGMFLLLTLIPLASVILGLNPVLSLLLLLLGFSDWGSASQLSFAVQLNRLHERVVTDTGTSLMVGGALFGATALFWLLWHESGFWGTLAPFKKEKAQRSKLSGGALSTGVTLSILWRAFLFSLWLYAVQQISLGIMLIWGSLFGTGLEAPWVYPATMLPFVVYPAGIASVLILPLLYLLGDTRAPVKVFAVRLIMPVILTLLSLLPLWQLLHFVTRYEFDRDFFSITHVDTSRRHTTTVVELGDNAFKVFMYRSEVTVSDSAFPLYGPGQAPAKASGMFRFVQSPLKTYWQLRDLVAVKAERKQPAFEVHCGRENVRKVEKLRDHLERRDYQTALALSYFGYLTGRGVGGCYGANWELDKLVETSYASFAKTNSVTEGMSLVSRRFAQSKPSYVDALERLSDERLFHLSATFALRWLGYAYSYYGLHDRARQMYDRARSQGYDGPLPKLVSLTKKFSDGLIRGRLLINGRPKSEIKVGLLVDPEARQKVGKPFIGLSPSYGGSKKRLVGAAATDGDGRFTFDRVLADEYYLGIMLEDDNVRNRQIIVSQEKPFNQITISEREPVVELGRIDVAFYRPWG